MGRAKRGHRPEGPEEPAGSSVAPQEAVTLHLVFTLALRKCVSDAVPWRVFGPSLWVSYPQGALCLS